MSMRDRGARETEGQDRQRVDRDRGGVRETKK